MKKKILIVDDEKPTRDVLVRALSRTYDCLAAPDGEQALALVKANPDLTLVLTDYKMPGMNGVALIQAAKKEIPDLGAILLTAFGEVELAVDAMKKGADDFITKPVTDLDELELRIGKAVKTGDLVREVADLRSQLDQRRALEDFTGSSPAMERVYKVIRQAAPATANVLVEGPSGTGKELVARALHRLSPRAAGPFVAVECAALSASLLESELFGYEAGAFTGANARGKIGRFEAASGGTLFLDEIGEIDLATQVKLLRVLEGRVIQRVGGNADIPVDFRLVAATNRDLAQMVAAGTFREDLYYRLNVIAIRMPALRERPGDVALLAVRFLREFSAQNGSRVAGFAPDALRALEAYAWPGNVRQLRNVVERMVVLAAGPTLTVDDLPPEVTAPAAPAVPAALPPAVPAPAVPAYPAPRPAITAPAAPAFAALPAAPASQPAISLADAERQQILTALAAAGGNKSRAAEMLGISRRTLHRKIKEWTSSPT